MAPLSWFTKSTLKYTPAIVELMVISVVLRLLGLVQPFVFQTLIDRVLPFQREATLMLILVFLIGTALFTAALGAISGYLHNYMANSLTMEMGGRIFSHILRLPLRLQQKYHVGETLSRINEIDAIRTFLTGTVSNIILDVLFAIIYLGALFAISPSLAAIVLIMVPLQAIVFSIIGPFIRARLQQSFLAGSDHQTRLVEGFSNIITLKALASENTNNTRFQETLNNGIMTGFKVAKLNILNGTLSDFLSNVTVICVIFFGAKQVFANQITLGELIAFHLIADKVSGPVHSLTTVWEQWQGLRIARLRLGDFLNSKTEDDVAKPSLEVTYPVELTLNDIHFGYDDYHVIAGFSANFAWQKPTVIIGHSGCGKSTLAKIMCGLYSPSQGTVAVNGNNIADFNVQSVRHQIAYVEQEPTLFSGTVRDNMRLVKSDATDDEIVEILKTCAAYEFVMGFPHGLGTEVGERGRSLSGGQRQRLALARSLLTKPKLLILDEPTSALDDDATQMVVETLKLIAKSTTLIVITHKAELLGEDVTYIDMAEGQKTHVI